MNMETFTFLLNWMATPSINLILYSVSARWIDGRWCPGVHPSRILSSSWPSCQLSFKCHSKLQVQIRPFLAREGSEMEATAGLSTYDDDIKLIFQHVKCEIDTSNNISTFRWMDKEKKGVQYSNWGSFFRSIISMGWTLFGQQKCNEETSHYKRSWSHKLSVFFECVYASCAQKPEAWANDLQKCLEIVLGSSIWSYIGWDAFIWLDVVGLWLRALVWN